MLEMLHAAVRKVRKSASLAAPVGPAVIIKSTSPISRVSNGEPIKWMAAETGVLRNVRFYSEGFKGEQDIVFKVVKDNFSTEVKFSVKPETEVTLPDIPFEAGERVTLTLPEGTTEAWLAGVFARKDVLEAEENAQG
jgi:hypothetical protein